MVRTPETDKRVTLLFRQVQHMSANEQSSFLDEACAGEPEIRNRVEKLLQAERMLSDIFGQLDLESPSVEPKATARGLKLRAPDGRYEDLGEIGRGGMGEVRLIRDPDLHRELAVKLLRTDKETRQDALDRFIEEAQLTAQLAHPGVVPVHELGENQDGQAYFTMARVEGEELTKVYARTRSGDPDWTPTRTLGVLTRVCETMAFAHSRGVIHRDLKPANVMVGEFGEVYVMDWGIAKLVGRQPRGSSADAEEPLAVTSDRETASRTDDALRTLDGQIMGTAVYMSPEQARGDIDSLDERSDVYAIGAMLYELLAGAPPYEAEGRYQNVVQVVLARQQGPPAPLEQWAPEAAPELVAITEKAMASDPRERYPDTGAMAEDMRAFLENRVVRAYRTGPIVELTKWVQRNKAVAGVLALLLLAIVSGLGGINAVQAQGQKRVLRLSDGKRIDLLESGQRDLWPPLPSKVPAMEEWLFVADSLLEKRDEYEAEIRRLDAGEEVTDSGVKAAGLGLRSDQPTLNRLWLRDSFEDLLRSLDGLDVLANELRTKRLAFARTVESRSLDSVEARSRWQAAREAIRTSELYGGLELAPQLGLLPLGADPESGYWEFLHLHSGAPSGAAPERDEDTGRWKVIESTGIVLVLVPGGEFTIGANPAKTQEDLAKPYYAALRGTDVDESPAHSVKLDPFFLSKYELTNAQWARIMGTWPTSYTTDEEGGPTHPVTRVSYYDCEEALHRWDLQFPTEAQYEVAARAGSTAWFPTGNDLRALEGYANIADMNFNANGGRGAFNEIDDRHFTPCVVDALRPNAFGLHNMHGNVWSWCRDDYLEYGYLQAEGDAHQPGDGVILLDPGRITGGTIRGGSWSSEANNVRSSNRFQYNRNNNDGDLGLRPARRVDP